MACGLFGLSACYQEYNLKNMISNLHPLIIHFPIALFSVAILFDLLFLLYKIDDFLASSWWTMFFALISSSAAIATGIIDDTLIGHLTTAFPLWTNHGIVQIFSCFIFLGLFIWRTKEPNILNTKISKLIYIIIGIINLSLLYYGGHLGARLAGRV